MRLLQNVLSNAVVGGILILGLALTLPGCDSSTSDDSLVASDDLNVAERIDVQDDLGTLKGALQDADRFDDLRNENTEFTVFATTLGDVNTDALKRLDAFEEVIDLHVVQGETLSASDLSDGDTYSTLSGDDISVSVSGGTTFINGAPITEADLPAQNGVVHVIGGTLLDNQDVRTRIAVTGETETYNNALVANENLNGEDASPNYNQLDGFTVFAPKEFSWIEWDTGGSNPIFDGLFADASLLQDLLEYHVVDQELSSSDLRSQAAGDGEIQTVGGETLEVSETSDGGLAINDARVDLGNANLQSTDGIVHLLEARPSPSFYGTLGAPIDILEGVPSRDVMTVQDRINNSVFTIFASIGGLFSASPIGDPTADITAFIPTNDAFANFNTDNLLNGFNNENPFITDTESFFAGRSLIDGHIISGDSLSRSDLAEAGSGDYTTVNGNDLSVRVKSVSGGSDSLFIASETTEIPVSSYDLETNNGVIHYIDQGLIQSQLDVSERAMFASPLSNLANGIYETNRAGSPLSPGPLNGSSVTLFAPTNDAFAASLPQGVPSDLIQNETGIYETILNYHAVDQDIDPDELTAGATFTTLQGQDVEVTSVGPPVEINGQPIQQPDTASNGFLYPANGVLLPAPETFNLVERAVLQGNLQFRTALEVTNNRSTVESRDGLTVLAPGDAAFQEFLDANGISGLRSSLISETNLDSRLEMHVATRQLTIDDIRQQLAGEDDVFTVETLRSESTGNDDFRLAFTVSGGVIQVQPNFAVGDSDLPPVALDPQDVVAENGFIQGISTIFPLSV